MRQRSPGTCEPAEQQQRPRGGALGRGAVPQRLLGSSPCHCVTSRTLAIKTAADATKGYAVYASKIRKCFTTLPLFIT